MLRPKLTYFDAAASRGEECRLALFVAGVDFDDNRIARSTWLALKPTVPFGSLPIFELPGKPALSQSNAILNYVGRSHGLLPKDEWEASRLISLMCAARAITPSKAPRAASSKTFLFNTVARDGAPITP